MTNLKLVVLTETGELWSDDDGELSFTVDCSWAIPPKSNNKKRTKFQKESYTCGEVNLPDIQVHLLLRCFVIYQLIESYDIMLIVYSFHQRS